MGVFVLVKNIANFNKESLFSIIQKKKLNKSVEENIGNYTLYLFNSKKKKFNQFSDNEDAIYSVGTIVYKEESYDKALQLYLNDFKNNCVNEECVYGDFILIIRLKLTITIVRERCQISKIFHLNKNIISNSFLVTLLSSNQKFSINKQSVKENVLLGYILNPKTIVNEIHEVYKLNGFDDLKFKYFNADKIFIKKEYNEKEVFERTIQLLNKQYTSISEAFNNKGVDIGLSGGYDSRLNLILANKKMKVHPHSHYKERYDKDLEIAKALCEELKLELKTKKIKPFIEIEKHEDLIELLEDTFYYYDGRVVLNTGFFNEIYSRKYREFITEKAEITLTGFGGEIFRNFNYQPKGRLNIDSWFKNFVFSYYNYAAIEFTEENRLFFENVKIDILKKLGIENEKRISFATRRLYFSDVWIPMTYAVKSFAENQLTYFISPFISYDIKKLSNEMNKVIAENWNFQANLIQNLSPNLAAIPSSYNFTFAEDPKLFEIKNKILNNKYSLGLKNFMQKKRFESIVKNNTQKENMLFDEILSHIFEYIDGVKIEYIKSSINWYYNVLSVALIIKKIKEHNVRIEKLNN